MKLMMVTLTVIMALSNEVYAGANQKHPKPPASTRLEAEEAEEIKAVSAICDNTALRVDEIYNCVKSVSSPQYQKTHVDGLALDVFLKRLSTK